MIKQVGILLFAFAVGAGTVVAMTRPACSTELSVRITQQPATVPGQWDVSPSPFYDQRGWQVLKRAPAVAYRVDEAPANGCEGRGGFREESGPLKGRCFGY